LGSLIFSLLLLHHFTYIFFWFLIIIPLRGKSLITLPLRS
jgi:hypothetical protein